MPKSSKPTEPTAAAQVDLGNESWRFALLATAKCVEFDPALSASVASRCIDQASDISLTIQDPARCVMQRDSSRNSAGQSAVGRSKFHRRADIVISIDSRGRHVAGSRGNKRSYSFLTTA